MDIIIGFIVHCITSKFVMSSSTLWWLYNFIVDVLPMHTTTTEKKEMQCDWDTLFLYLLNALAPSPPPSDEKSLHFSLASYDQFHMTIREMKTNKLQIGEIIDWHCCSFICRIFSKYMSCQISPNNQTSLLNFYFLVFSCSKSPSTPYVFTFSLVTCVPGFLLLSHL